MKKEMKKNRYLLIICIMGIVTTLSIARCNLFNNIKENVGNSTKTLETYNKYSKFSLADSTLDNKLETDSSTTDQIKNIFTEEETKDCKPIKWLETEEVKNMTEEELQSAIEQWKNLGVDYENIIQLCTDTIS